MLRRWPAAEVLLGGGTALGVAAILSRADDVTPYRPGTLLLGTVVAVAVFLGLRAGVAAAVVASAGVWFRFTPAINSFRLTRALDAVSVLVFVLTTAGVLVLVARLEAGRRREGDQRQVTDALLNAAPVGIAMFDRRLRYERLNRRLAEINGVPASAQLGRRPGELDPTTGGLYEPIVAEVLASQVPVENRMLTVTDPVTAVERHWRTSYFPVDGGRGEVVGVGSIVEEVTGDVVARRRSERLLVLAQELAAALDPDQLVRATAEFLADAFSARAAVWVVGDDRATLSVHLPTVGYPDDAEGLWRDERFGFADDLPVAEAARSQLLLSIPSAQEYDQRYPANRRRREVIGDEACVLVPVVDPLDRDGVLAVLRIGWPHTRPLTPTSATLCETVASMVALAMNRIRLATAAIEDRFRTALDVMLDDVAIGRAVRDPDGRIIDFVIEFMNAHSLDGAGRGASEMVGRRVCDLYPSWRDSGMLDRFRTVVETGEPFLGDRLEYEDHLADGTTIRGYWNLQVVRLDDSYIAASRDVTDVVRADEARREADEARSREQMAVQLLQRAALPVELPRIEGLDIGAHYQPAAVEQPVGGDWYDAFRREDGTVALVMADVAGHGADAASFMVQVRNILRAVAAEHARPGDVLERVNHITTAFNGDRGPFVTCCYGILDVDAETMSWSLAGHPPPLLVSDGVAVFPQHRPGPPLALFGEVNYRTSVVSIHPGSRLVLYTDGLIERRDEPLDTGLARLVTAVDDCSTLDAAGTAMMLGDSVVDPFDDLAVMVVDLR